MYKFSDNQISFSDFKQPIGMKMNVTNRWVKKAESIPWKTIEKKYAKLFSNKKGNVAKPLRLALGACIIQAEYGYSDVETALQIQEGPYLQFFCGFCEYRDEPPFDPSLMVYFRKRLTPEILGEINELIIQNAEADKVKDESDDQDDSSSDEPPQNSGTLIVDATCAPSHIRYPQDTALLNEARENAEAMITEMHDPSDGRKPRTYAGQAHKDHLNLVRKKKNTAKTIRKAIGKQLRYLRRDLAIIDTMLSHQKILSKKWQVRLETIRCLYEQQKYMYDNHTHQVENRIVSLSQPHLRPIVRGKTKAPVEFGAKLDISVVDGYTRLEKVSFDAYNESSYLIDVIERYKDRVGVYPSRILADKIYRNRANLKFCKEKGIRLSGPALGRPPKNAVIDKRQDYVDICERVEVERKFSLAKLKCGLGLIRTRLPETGLCTIALSIVVLNLRKVLYALFQFFMPELNGDSYFQKLVIIQ
ncbi:MAG: IS5 family transposase [Acetobacterium sp.]|nr:IS5 family transposase [Bacillota bacterium]MCG2729041.1 IS5 family transposase [Acetobacterium sp.]